MFSSRGKDQVVSDLLSVSELAARHRRNDSKHPKSVPTRLQGDHIPSDQPVVIAITLEDDLNSDAIPTIKNLEQTVSHVPPGPSVSSTSSSNEGYKSSLDSFWKRKLQGSISSKATSVKSIIFDEDKEQNQAKPFLGAQLAAKLKFSTLVDALHDSEIPAIRSVDHREPITHSQLRQFIGDCQLPLSGVTTGSRIGVLLSEGPELGVCLLAVMSCCCAVPINYNLTCSEIIAELTCLKTQAVIIEHSRKEDPIISQLLDASLSILLLKPDPNRAGLFTLTRYSSPRTRTKSHSTTSSALSHTSHHPTNLSRGTSIVSFLLPQDRPHTTPETTTLLLRTSGTTGRKKTVPYPLKTLLLSANCIATSWSLRPETDICLNMMPLTHVGGIVRNLLAPLVSCSTVILTPGFDAALFWDVVRYHSPTWYYAVPSMHLQILEEGDSQRWNMRSSSASASASARGVSSVRLIANAGGGLPHSLAVRLKAMFQGAVVLPSYGMTECMPIAAPPVGFSVEMKPGTSGVSVGPEICVFEVGDDVPCSVGGIGRVMVRGDPLFEGYEGGEQEIPFTEDGWFDTGDIGYLDDENYLFITGRSKEVINRGGEIMSPVEVEDAVLTHPNIQNTIAFSVGHQTLQETIGLAIVCKNDSLRMGLTELQRFVSSKLHPTKWPQLLVFMSDIPKNHTNKPLRINLAHRLSLPEISDTTPIHQKIYEAACPPIGTPLTEMILCTRAPRITVSELSPLLTQMPYKNDVFVFSDTADSIAVLVSGPERFSSDVVRTYLASKIHEYDIPATILVVSEVPRDTETGDVDVEACLELYEEETRETLSDVEECVVIVFTEVLGLKRRVRKSDDFFELGGTSLAAGKVGALIRGKLGVKLPPMALFKYRTIAKFSEVIQEKLDSMKKSAADNVELNYRKPFNPEEIKSESPTRPFALFIQSLSLFLFNPLRIAIFCLLFANFLCFFQGDEFSQFKHAPRGTLAGSMWILLDIMISIFSTAVVCGFMFPAICLAGKWLIIGKYKAGSYPLWGSYYLRWWIVDQLLLVFGMGFFKVNDTGKTLFFRMMGAQIGWNVRFHSDSKIREFDLIHIYPDCVIVTNRVSAFTMEAGLMILKPITLGSNCVINYGCTLAPGCVIPANTVLPPLSSSYELNESSQNHRIFASLGPSSPNFLSLLFIGYPIVFIVRLWSLFPWLAVLYWLVQFPFLSTSDEESYHTLSFFGQLITHWGKSYRISLHVLGAVVKATVCPIFELIGTILVKRYIIGKFEAGQRKNTQWNLLQHWIMNALFVEGEFMEVYELLGRHYEGISIIYRLLGAKIGKRVYWPGTCMKFHELDLLEVGNDVVFGSRSKLSFSDSVESRKIKIEDGAMIADRCVVLPGVTVGRNAMIGSGSLLCKNGYYPPGSTWIGSKNGDALLWEEGDASAALTEPTLKPFGRGFCMNQANYTVLGQLSIFSYNVITVALTGCAWVIPPLCGVIVTGIYFDPLADSPLRKSDAIGMLIFLVSVLVSYAFLSIFIFMLPICSKWLLLGHLKTGNHDWDKSSYCQRWQIHISIQKVLDKVQDQIRGSFYLVAYFRLLGAQIGERVCLYPTGADPMMTEPELVSIGDHTVVDKASIISHINTKGSFVLNNLRIGKGCSLRTDSRLLSGAEMNDGSQLLEHTLIVGGEVVESGSVMQGWPAKEMRTSKTGDFISSSQLTLENSGKVSIISFDL